IRGRARRMLEIGGARQRRLSDCLVSGGIEDRLGLFLDRVHERPVDEILKAGGLGRHLSPRQTYHRRDVTARNTSVAAIRRSGDVGGWSFPAPAPPIWRYPQTQHDVPCFGHR